VPGKQWDRAYPDATECTPETPSFVLLGVHALREQRGCLHDGAPCRSADLIQDRVPIPVHCVEGIFRRPRRGVSRKILRGCVESILCIEDEMHSRPVRVLQCEQQVRALRDKRVFLHRWIVPDREPPPVRKQERHLRLTSLAQEYRQPAGANLEQHTRIHRGLRLLSDDSEQCKVAPVLVEKVQVFYRQLQRLWLAKIPSAGFTRPRATRTGDAGRRCEVTRPPWRSARGLRTQGVRAAGPCRATSECDRHGNSPETRTASGAGELR
jgi:hypothetical protein